MKITKSGSYIFENNFSDKIAISDGINAKIFLKNISAKIDFDLKNNSFCEVYSVNSKFSNFDLNIFQNCDNSKMILKSLFLGFDSDILTNINSRISGENNSAEIEIFGIVKEKKLSLNSKVSILKNSKNIVANLSQKNIFIGNNGKISGSPQLFVSSKDVKANHSCKIEKIDPNLIFYLQSRGLSHNEAVNLLVKNIVNGVVDKFPKDKNLHLDIANFI